jgi:hypothetical protein
MASADSPAAALRPSPDVVVRRLGDAGVLVHLPSNRIFELNDTGMRIWEGLVEGVSLSTILDRLRDEFAVGPAEAVADVDAFVRDLRHEQFLLA